MKNQRKYKAGVAVTAIVGLEEFDEGTLLVVEVSGKIVDFCLPSQMTIIHGIFGKYADEQSIRYDNVTKVSDTKFVADIIFN